MWQPDQPSPAPVALLPDCNDVKSCRIWIESWLADLEQQQPADELLLWVDAANASYAGLSQLRLLVELMGF